MNLKEDRTTLCEMWHARISTPQMRLAAPEMYGKHPVGDALGRGDERIC